MIVQLFNIEKKINLKRRKLIAKGKTGVESRAIATNVLETIISSGGNVEACLKEARVLHKKRFLGEKRIDRFVKTVLRLIEKKGHLNNQFARKLNAEFRKSGVTGIGEDKGAPDGDGEGDGSDKKDEEDRESSASHRPPPLSTALTSIMRVCKKSRSTRRWEQSKALIARAQDGDNEARNEAVEVNMGLVVTVAKRYMYMRDGLLLEDLVGYGVEGLMIAVERFDLKNGAQFSTYAPHWIKQAIRRSIVNYECTIRLPIHKADEIAKERKVDRGNGKEESSFSQVTQISSLDKKMRGKEEDGDELINFIPSGDPGPERQVMNLQIARKRKEMVALLKSRLSAVQWFVLEMRFCFNGSGEEKTSLEDIGKELSLTRERVRQIEQSAFKKARKILKDFYSAGLH